MKKFHPDTNPASDAGRKAQAINEAYLVLSDPIRRKEYDKNFGQRARPQGSTASSSSEPPQSPQNKPNPHQRMSHNQKQDGVGIMSRLNAVPGWLKMAGAMFCLFVVIPFFAEVRQERREAAEAEAQASFVAAAQECVASLDDENGDSPERIFSLEHPTLSYQGNRAKDFNAEQFEIVGEGSPPPKYNSRVGLNVQWSPTVVNRTTGTIDSLKADFIIVDVTTDGQCRIVWEDEAWEFGLRLRSNRTQKINFQTPKDNGLRNLPPIEKGFERFVIAGIL